MSCSLSDFLLPGNRGRSIGPACLRCIHRNDCPYSRDRVFENSLHQTALQGQAVARLLTEEAERLLAEISCADNAGHFLCANEVLEYTLSNMLHAELASMERLSTLEI